MKIYGQNCPFKKNELQILKINIPRNRHLTCEPPIPNLYIRMNSSVIEPYSLAACHSKFAPTNFFSLSIRQTKRITFQHNAICETNVEILIK